MTLRGAPGRQSFADCAAISCSPRAPKRRTDAELSYRDAIAVAQRQRARSLELRAATALAQLLQGQGRSAEALQVLAPIYDWFTEGLDTADLRTAKTLLDELR